MERQKQAQFEQDGKLNKNFLNWDYDPCKNIYKDQTRIVAKIPGDVPESLDFSENYDCEIKVANLEIEEDFVKLTNEYGLDTEFLLKTISDMINKRIYKKCREYEPLKRLSKETKEAKNNITIKYCEKRPLPALLENGRSTKYLIAPRVTDEFEDDD